MPLPLLHYFKVILDFTKHFLWLHPFIIKWADWSKRICQCSSFAMLFLTWKSQCKIWGIIDHVTGKCYCIIKYMSLSLCSMQLKVMQHCFTKGMGRVESSDHQLVVYNLLVNRWGIFSRSQPFMYHQWLHFFT